MSTAAVSMRPNCLTCPCLEYGKQLVLDPPAFQRSIEPPPGPADAHFSEAEYITLRFGPATKPVSYPQQPEPPQQQKQTH